MSLYKSRSRRSLVPLMVLVVAVLLLPLGGWLVARSFTTRPPVGPASTSVGAGSGALSPAGSAPAAAGGPAAPPATGNRAPGTGPGTVSRVVSWISEFTPTGGGGFTTADAYQELARDDCQAAEETATNLDGVYRTLYDGAAAACLATMSRAPLPLWSRAESALTTLESRPPGFGCDERDVLGLLRRLVETHRQDPGAAIVRQPPIGASGSTCPRIVAIAPDHGPAAGNQRVVLTGANLAETVTIDFGGTMIGPVGTGKGMHVEITTPPQVSNRTRVEVKTSDFHFEALVHFTYDPPDAQPAGSRAARPERS